jgi:hypothetical protein
MRAERAARLDVRALRGRLAVLTRRYSDRGCVTPVGMNFGGRLSYRTIASPIPPPPTMNPPIRRSSGSVKRFGGVAVHQLAASRVGQMAMRDGPDVLG